MTHKTAVQKHVPHTLAQALEDVLMDPAHWLHRDLVTLHAFRRMAEDAS